jgi:hypothetical protein
MFTLTRSTLIVGIIGLIVTASMIQLGRENQSKVVECLNKGWAPDACSLIVYGR